MNMSIIEPVNEPLPPNDILSPRARAHIQKPTETTSSDDAPPTGMKFLKPVRSEPLVSPTEKRRGGTMSDQDASVGTEGKRPVRPQRKRSKRAVAARQERHSSSESDQDQQIFQYSKKSTSKKKPTEKSKPKKSSKKQPENPTEATEITANKNSKKYREQRQAHLIANQKSANVDFSMGDVLNPPRTPPRPEKPRVPIEADSSGMGELNLDGSLGLNIADVGQPMRSQEPGRATPSWFQTPNASDAESQMTTMVNGTRRSLATEDQENDEQNQMVNNVLTNKLSKKVLKKKARDKGKAAQKRAKQKLDKRVLTPSNQGRVIQQLNKFAKQNKKKKGLGAGWSSEESSEDDVQDTTADIANQ